LKEVAVVWVPDSTAAVENLAHPPVFLGLFARQIIVFHDNRQSWSNVQEGWTL